MSHQATGFVLGKSRFEAFSDGVFAIAITLLVLQLHLPNGASTQTPGPDQVHALLAIWPQYLVYAATFATVGVMWVNHGALVHHLDRVTHGVLIANLLLLGLISFLPFATYVLAQYGLTRPTVVYYGLTLTAISVAYLLLQRAAMAAHPATRRPLSAWNLVGLTLYPVATLIGLLSPIAGLVVIGLLAIFYALPSNVQSAMLRA
ncbi:MAG TPA: TMEM175 family protein [Gemmatimonadaceae bacterium]|nr:TMEM175 family protein [Gemmatimonadaceae bacterium]